METLSTTGWAQYGCSAYMLTAWTNLHLTRCRLSSTVSSIWWCQGISQLVANSPCCKYCTQSNILLKLANYRIQMHMQCNKIRQETRQYWCQKLLSAVRPFLWFHHRTVSVKALFSSSSSATFVRLFIRSFRQMLLPQYLMSGLSNFDETYREYSLASTDALITFWRSRLQQAEVAKTSTLTLRYQSPSSYLIFRMPVIINILINLEHYYCC